MKCVVSKRTCLGYDHDGEKAASSRSPSSGAGSPLRPAIAYISSSPEEHRAFQYFQEQTAAQLCCYHSSELWSRIILQAAQTDPCIRHAIIALSSFHEIYTLPPSERQQASQFALRHYNTAIRHQIQASASKGANSEDADRYMTASILFICIELLQNHYVSAFSLLANAIKLVSASARPEKKSSAWPRKDIEAIYNRLQLQAFGILGPNVAADMGVPSAARPTYPPIPAVFSSIEEARSSLEDLVCIFTFAQNRQEKDVLLRCADLVEGARIMVNCWSTAFQGLLDQIGRKLSPQQEQGINVIRIWQLRAIATLEASAASAHMSNTKEVWDSMIMLGNKVVELAESVVQKAMASPCHRSRGFTLDHGVVEPMMATALMCRDPALRQRILEVLRRYPCREGLYDSALMICVAERAAHIEQAAVPNAKHASDIPAWARIDSVLPTLQFGDRHAVFQLTRQQKGMLPGPTELFEEVVSW